MQHSRESYCVHVPKKVEYNDGITIEYSIHTCPPKLLKEIHLILPDEKERLEKNELYIIPTWQPTKIDLTGWGDSVQEEKDEKLDKFMEWGTMLIKRAKQHGYWGDLLDPSSGLPVTKCLPFCSPYVLSTLVERAVLYIMNWKE